MYESLGRRGVWLFAAATAIISVARPARGDEPSAPPPASPSGEPAPATGVAPAPASETPTAPLPESPPPEAPAPYSLPWQLRGAAATTAIRSDTSFARYEDGASNHALTIASTLLASYKIPVTF